MLNGLKMQFNLNQCIVRGLDGKIITMGPHKGIYEIMFIELYGTNATNLAQLVKKNSACEFGHRRLGHLNVNGAHVL